MNTLGRFVIFLGYVVVSVETNNFSCPTKNPCILLDLDANFILSEHDKNGTKVAPVFDLQKAVVDETSCECLHTFFTTSSSVRLQLFPSGDSLRITFNTSEIPFRANPVDLKLDLTFNPKGHFPSENITIVNIQSSLMHIGKRKESFACNTTEILTFNSDPMYRMTMEIMNFKVQAFDVVDGKFSKAEICPNDTPTSTTTHAITTETTRHTMTSHQPTTEPTTHTMTSNHPTTEPVTHNMTSYHPTTETTTHNLTSHPTSEPTTHTMTSQPTTEPTTHNMTSHHPNTEPTTHTMTSQHTSEPTTHNITSHNPTTEPTSHSHKTHPMTTATTEPTTSHMTTVTSTSAPTTPMPSTPKFDVCNGSECCIIMTGNFMFHIEYEDSNNKTQMAEVKIPENATVTGNCNSVNTTQDITLHFANGWHFTVEIGEVATDDEAATIQGHMFSWQQYSLTYVMDEHFIFPNTPGAVKTIMGKPMWDNFAADEQGSYICNASQSLDLGSDNSALILSDLQYRAFGTTNSTTFPNNDVTRCQADQPSTTTPNPTTPTQAPNQAGTIVGAVVGTLVFLVVVAMAIMYMRKRSTMKKAQAYGEL